MPIKCSYYEILDNKDTKWEMFDKAFLRNRIITKISVPDVVR